MDKELIEKAKRHCESAYPEEGCGLIVGIADDPGSDRLVLCTNVQNKYHDLQPEKYPETGGEAFMMDPQELMEVLAEMKRRGEVLKAIFHSHPDGDADFSTADFERAVLFPDAEVDSEGRDGSPRSTAPVCPIYSAICYIIISVVNGRACEAKIFHWCESSGDFIEKTR